MKKWIQIGIQKQSKRDQINNNVDRSKSKRSRFSESISKSHNSPHKKEFVFRKPQSPSQIHDFSQEFVKQSQNGVYNSNIHPSKPSSEYQHQLPTKSRVKSMVSGIREVKNNKSYIETINGLKQEYEKFKNEVHAKLNQIEEYYSNTVQALRRIYQAQLLKIAVQPVSLGKIKSISTLQSSCSIFPSNNEIKHIPTLSNKPLYPSKSDSKIFQSNASLSELAGAIKEDKFKKFADILQKMKLDIDEQISIERKSKYEMVQTT